MNRRLDTLDGWHQLFSIITFIPASLRPIAQWHSLCSGTAQAVRCFSGETCEEPDGSRHAAKVQTQSECQMPNTTSLTSVWDFDNRLNTADVGSDGSMDVTYKFDAIGRRVFRDNGTTATIYVQAGQQTIADYTASSAPSSPTYRYVYASYIDEPVLRFKPSGSESLYYHRNQQYSVVALTSSSAAIVERYAYSAYGVTTITNAAGTLLPIGSVDNRYLYTGREWDQTLGLYHYRARMYDANLGRFASRDPIGYRGSKWNLCQIGSGKLLQRVDPSGLTARDVMAICQEKKSQWEARRLKEIQPICPTTDVSVQCISCNDKNRAWGSTTCEKAPLGRRKVTISICADFVERSTTSEEEARKEIAKTLIHEDMHATDYCSCK